MQGRFSGFIALMLVVLSACQSRPTITPIPEKVLLSEPTAIAVPEPARAIDRRPTQPVSGPATATRAYPAPAATLESAAPATIVVEATIAAQPNESRLAVETLPIGEPGHYVNLALGYSLEYPPTWHTQFGNRPILVSLSDLDPGTHNRSSMRDEGCLIEVDASVNIQGFSLDELTQQLPRVFAGAQVSSLDGLPALRIERTGEGDSFDSEWIYVEYDDHMFLISVEHSKVAGETCHQAWDLLLSSWRWLDPEFAVYRNSEYGYSISAPRSWYRFNAHPAGLWISSADPTSHRWVDLMRQGILIETDVHENADGLSLEEWVVAQDLDVALADDIPVGDIVGIRVLRAGPIEGVEQLSAYFMGPLGRIYEVSCAYPSSEQGFYQPIANAAIFSFGF